MNHNLEYRKYVIGGIALVIVIVYTIRLFVLQIMSDDYRKSADSNAFLKKIEYPSRGVISDRNGELLVYNQPAYDIMVVMNEAKNRLDTLEFCQALGISKSYFIKRMNRTEVRTLAIHASPNSCSWHSYPIRTLACSEKSFSAFRASTYNNVA